jgi:hypothetical protein
LKASFVETIYAVQKGARVRFEISYLPLELFREIISSPQFSNSNPDARIAEVELRKIADHSRELKLIMEKALNLISTKSIINQFSDVSELIEVINGIPKKLSFYEPHSQRNMLLEAFYEVPGEFSKGRQREDFVGIDVFHKTLKLTARFHIDENQTESLLKKLNLSSEFQLTGDGWYIYDLTDEIRFQKAIPAILIEMAYSKLTEDPNIDLNEVLHPAYWRIGLA